MGDRHPGQFVAGDLHPYPDAYVHAVSTLYVHTGFHAYAYSVPNPYSFYR
jgi:hypothetical protein